MTNSLLDRTWLLQVTLLVMAVQSAVSTAYAFNPLLTSLSPDERAFRADCQRSCAGPSNSQQICREVCACTVDGLKRENLWQKALSDTLSSEESTRMTRLAQACLRGP